MKEKILSILFLVRRNPREKDFYVSFYSSFKEYKEQEEKTRPKISLAPPIITITITAIAYCLYSSVLYYEKNIKLETKEFMESPLLIIALLLFWWGATRFVFIKPELEKLKKWKVERRGLKDFKSYLIKKSLSPHKYFEHKFQEDALHLRISFEQKVSFTEEMIENFLKIFKAVKELENENLEKVESLEEGIDAGYKVNWQQPQKVFLKIFEKENRLET